MISAKQFHDNNPTCANCNQVESLHIEVKVQTSDHEYWGPTIEKLATICPTAVWKDRE